MKTWEMIKEVTENPKKKFVSKTDSSRPSEKLVYEANDYGYIVGVVEEYTSNTLNVNTDWEEVIEPVDYLTAYNDCEKCGNNYIDEYNERKLEFNFGCVHMVYLKEHLVTVGSGIILGNIKWIKQ